MRDSKAYSLTKRQLISAQRQISRSVLIRVSEKFEIPPSSTQAARNTELGALFTAVVLHGVEACSEYQTQHLNRNQALLEEIVNNQRQY